MTANAPTQTTTRQPMRCLIVRQNSAGVLVQSATTERPTFIPREAFNREIYEGAYVPGIALDVIVDFDGNSRWCGMVALAEFSRDTMEEELEELRKQVALNTAQQIMRRVENQAPDLSFRNQAPSNYDRRTGWQIVCHYTDRSGVDGMTFQVTAETYTAHLVDHILDKM